MIGLTVSEGSVLSWPYAFGQRIMVVAAYGGNRSLLLSEWKQRGGCLLASSPFPLSPKSGAWHCQQLGPVFPGSVN